VSVKPALSKSRETARLVGPIRKWGTLFRDVECSRSAAGSVGEIQIGLGAAISEGVTVMKGWRSALAKKRKWAGPARRQKTPEAIDHTR